MSEGPVGVIFSVSEEDVVNGVDFTFRRLVRWNDPAVGESTDGDRTAKPRDGAIIQAIGEQTIDLLTPKPFTIKGVRGDTSAYGDQTITYDVPGALYVSSDDGDTLQSMDLVEYVTGAGEVIVDRRGWGAIKGELEVFDAVAGEPGDYVDLQLPHQVNALVGQDPVTQRGGTRKVQVYGRTPKPGTAVLHLEDAGNIAQTLPTPDDDPDPVAIPVPEFDLAPSDDNPLTVVTATVTNDADLEDVGASVEWEYAVSDTEPAGPGTAFGPLALGFGVDTIDVPEVPTGSEVWVRARSVIGPTGERSDWSDWQSITLGPDDDGTGGTLPPFLLALQYDSAGVLSATANSVVAEITKVYFLAGLAGGAAPLYANVVAVGSVDASGPPFTASSLATMAEGEVRTVGAIGEDALGNRTTLVTASITRAIDTGAGGGTPGNLSLTLLAGPPVVCRDVGAALREYKGLKRARKYWNTARVGKARLQPNVWEPASEGSELHWVYSLTGGPPFAESGVFVRCDRVNFPEPGAYLALGAGAIGPNVLFGLATKNGDGTMTLKTSDVFVDTVSSAAPPDSPSGDPPDPGDLPEGGSLGTLILDLNAATLLTLGRADDSDVKAAAPWPDDTGNVPDAQPTTAGGLQSAPKFKTTAFPGALPCVRVSGTTDGVSVEPPTIISCTWHFVVGNVTGSGANGDNQQTNAPIAITAGASGSSFWTSVRADGTVQSAVNDAAGNGTGKVGTADVSGTGPHLVSLAWNHGGGEYEVYVDAVLDHSKTHSIITNSWSSVTFVAIGNVNTIAHKLDADYHRVFVYDQAHDAADVAVVYAALQAAGILP